MRAVLGIDAAWTLKQASGVALVVEHPKGWQLIAVAPSYQHFQALADPGRTIEPRPSGSSPHPLQLIAAAEALCDRSVDLVAIDIPLAQSPIVKRRASDDAVSKAYGGRKCGTHSPNASRPGRISDELQEGFEGAGYPLQTCMVEPPGLIEVYPHPALVELFGLQRGCRTRLQRSRGIGRHLPGSSGECACTGNGGRSWNGSRKRSRA